MKTSMDQDIQMKELMKRFNWLKNFMGNFVNRSINHKAGLKSYSLDIILYFAKLSSISLVDNINILMQAVSVFNRVSGRYLYNRISNDDSFKIMAKRSDMIIRKFDLLVCEFLEKSYLRNTERAWKNNFTDWHYLLVLKLMDKILYNENIPDILKLNFPFVCIPFCEFESISLIERFFRPLFNYLGNLMDQDKNLDFAQPIFLLIEDIFHQLKLRRIMSSHLAYTSYNTSWRCYFLRFLMKLLFYMREYFYQSFYMITSFSISFSNNKYLRHRLLSHIESLKTFLKCLPNFHRELMTIAGECFLVLGETIKVCLIINPRIKDLKMRFFDLYRNLMRGDKYEVHMCIKIAMNKNLTRVLDLIHFFDNGWYLKKFLRYYKGFYFLLNNGIHCIELGSSKSIVDLSFATYASIHKKVDPYTGKLIETDIIELA